MTLKRPSRFACACCAVAALLSLGGCASTSSTRSAPQHDFALTTLGYDTDPAGPQQPGVFRLGAGDALGQAIFANYVAVARTNQNWQYAGAETDSTE